MKVSAARAAAVDWVERHAAAQPGFVGAYFSGSTIYLPEDAEVPVGADVDVMVVSEREEASRRDRPVAIDGTAEQIRAGNHREVVFWLLATYSRCHVILAADAPEVERERWPAFAALLGDLGIRSPADLGRRVEATAALLPTLWEATEAILAEV